MKKLQDLAIRNAQRLGAAVVLGAGVASANAAALVVPPEVAEAGTNAGILGLAVLGVLVGIRAFKWIRQAM